MDKVNLLVAIGRLEVAFKENDLILKDLQILHNCILLDAPLEAAVVLGRLTKMTENIECNCSVEFRLIFNYLSDTEIKTSIVPDIPIDDLDFSVRTFNCLKRAGINTFNDLAKSTQMDLMKIRNLGRLGYEEILKTLSSYGVFLKESNE